MNGRCICKSGCRKADNKDFTSFNKEEWAARKQQERADAYAPHRRDRREDDRRRRTVPDLSGCAVEVRPLPVGNALLIAAQMPDANRLADFNGWKDNDTYVKRRDRHHHSEPGDEHTRDDGSTGVSYNAKRSLISQTTMRQKTAPNVSHDPRLLLKAFINNAPCQISISDALPENVARWLRRIRSFPSVRYGRADIFRSLSGWRTRTWTRASIAADRALPPTVFPMCSANAAVSRTPSL